MPGKPDMTRSDTAWPVLLSAVLLSVAVGGGGRGGDAPLWGRAGARALPPSGSAK